MVAAGFRRIPVKTMQRRKLGEGIAPDRAPMICENSNGAAAVKAVAARKATVKRGRSYASEKSVPLIVVREESRSYPESTNRLIEQLGDLRNHQTALPRIARDAKLTALIEKAVLSRNPLAESRPEELAEAGKDSVSADLL